MEKPLVWGDTYYCYKKHLAIIVFAMVDAHGRFTYVNAGGAGQIEDASVWKRSALRALIGDGTWLAVPENMTSKRMTLDGIIFRPYNCAFCSVTHFDEVL
jgi:hypothetical protein